MILTIINVFHVKNLIKYISLLEFISMFHECNKYSIRHNLIIIFAIKQLFENWIWLGY